MKARIEKKLSKRLVEIAPNLFKHAWICNDVTVLAEKQGSRVSHCFCVGGGVDYWGEGQDSYTVWDRWLDNWMWCGNFPLYPEGHRFEHHPNTDGFKKTTRNLLALARQYELNTQTGGGRE